MSHLQFRITPKRRCSSEIVRRRHIRPRRLRQAADELHPRIPCRHIAAIEQDVAAYGEGLPDDVKLTGVRGKRGAVDDAAAQRHAAGTAMGDDVNRLDAGSPLQAPGNLIEPVGSTVENDDFGIGWHAREE